MLIHDRVLIFRNRRSNMIRECYNYEYFAHDFKHKIFVICFGKHDVLILNFIDYSFIGEYKKV